MKLSVTSMRYDVDLDVIGKRVIVQTTTFSDDSEEQRIFTGAAAGPLLAMFDAVGEATEFQRSGVKPSQATASRLVATLEQATDGIAKEMRDGVDFATAALVEKFGQ